MRRKLTPSPRRQNLWAIEPVKCKRTQHNILWSNHGLRVVRPGTSKQDTNAQQLPLLTDPPSSSLFLMRHSKWCCTENTH